MELEILFDHFSVCKLADTGGVDFSRPFCFLCKTDLELSLLCETSAVPADTLAREDGWRGLRVRGPLDFGLTGILAGISGALAASGIPIFAVSTFDTDYIFVKSEYLGAAEAALKEAGYKITP